MAWGLSPSKYVIQAVKNCQVHLTDKLNGKYSIPTRADNLFPVNYDPSTDLSDILDPECSSSYQHLIGVMRWMVELGRIDIATEVSMLSSYLACPHQKQHYVPYYLSIVIILSHKYAFGIISMFFTLVRCSIVLLIFLLTYCIHVSYLMSKFIAFLNVFSCPTRNVPYGKSCLL
jgi:hypothetical protein